jgi:glycosyltransferase involved in cell wall biosynthesis
MSNIDQIISGDQKFNESAAIANVRVAVIIPFFNEIEKLDRAVMSLIAQSLKPAQVVFVDDCGAERLDEAILEKLGSNGIPAKLVRNAVNLGPGGSRQAGMDSLDKDIEYLLFLDSDDYLSDDFLRRSVIVHQDSGDLVATFGNTINIETGINRVDDPGKPFKSLLDGLLIGRKWGTGALLWKYDQVKDVKWPSVRMVEDSFFEYEAARLNPRVSYVKDATLFIEQNWDVSRLEKRNRVNEKFSDWPIRLRLYERMLEEYPFDWKGREGRHHLRFAVYQWSLYTDVGFIGYFSYAFKLLAKGKVPVFVRLMADAPKYFLRKLREK